jgi:hypothetical protein
VRKRSKTINAKKRKDPDLNELLEVVRTNEKRTKTEPKKDLLERASKYL